jgi:hypothetical protein
MSNEYPAWERPQFVGDVPIEELPADLAQRYCEWFVAQVPVRAAELLSTLGIADIEGPQELLERVERAFKAFAQAPEFWRPSVGPQPIRLRIAVAMVDVGETLTDAGEALGLDVGVLLARELERAIDGLHWGIYRGRKDYVSFNRPLLIGAAPPSYDPQLIGTTIALKAIKPNAKPIGLAALFETWFGLLSAPAKSGPIP